jgi:hypothetical protein
MAEPMVSDDVIASETHIDDNPDPPSDASAATNPADNNPKEIPQESVEFFVKVEICAQETNRNGNIPFMKNFRGLLDTLAHYYSPGIIMYDKENKHLSKFVLAKMTTLTQFHKHFDTLFRTANAKKPARHMLAIKFKSAFSLYEIKNQEFVQKYLEESNIYLRDHSFEYVLDTTSPGWVFGKHPQHHWPDDVKLEMIADINLACPNQIVPFFHLESCTPRRTEDSGMNFRTQALGIHVDRNKNYSRRRIMEAERNRFLSPGRLSNYRKTRFATQ